MSQVSQILGYIKSINEKLNLWTANAKKIEELPVMDPMNPNGLLMVSELVGGIQTSKKLEIQKIIDSISLAGQNNTVREVLLGSIDVDHDLKYLFDNAGLTVSASELVILSALQTVNSTVIQRQFVWKLGKGDFQPIGSTNLNSKVLELQPKYINEILADEITNAPDAIVYDFGVITDDILTVLNNASPARNYSDDEKIYYIRFSKDGINYLYNFTGINGTYGDGQLQMTGSDLVLIYSSEISDISALINQKTDKGGYSGTAQDLKNLIDSLSNGISNGPYVVKAEAMFVDIVGTGVITDYALGYGETGFSFNDAITEFNSMHITFPYDSWYYDGRPLFMRNNQATDIKIKHIVSPIADYTFAFPNEEDFILKPNEIIEFKLDMITAGRGVYRYIGASSNSLQEAKDYADSLVVGLLDDRGNYDASTNLFPAVGGSGVAGVILKGDIWTVSVAGTLGGVSVTIGDVIRSLFDTPAQTSSNWVITENNLGYVPENNANKSNSISDVASTTKFPVWNVITTWIKENLAGALSAKTAIVDTDAILIGDSADSSKTKKITWLNFKALFKTIGGVSIFGSGDLAVSGTQYVSYAFSRYFGLNAVAWYVQQTALGYITTSSGTTNLITALSGFVVGNNLCVAPFDMKLVNISVAMRNASARKIGVVAGTPNSEHTISSVVSIYEQSSYSSAPSQIIDFDDTVTTITKGQLVRISVMHSIAGAANSSDTLTFTFKKV